MAKKPDLSILFKFKTKQGSADVAQGRANQIVKNVQEELKGTVVKKGSTQIAESLFRNRRGIQADLNNDINSFARKAVNFFTRIRSPNSGRARTGRGGQRASEKVLINLSQLNPDNNNPFAELLSSKVERLSTSSLARRVNAGTVTPFSLTWDALSPRTIANKKGRTSFFVNSGALKSMLITQLGPAFQKLINPRIDMETIKDSKVKGAKRIRVRALVNPRFNSMLLTDYSSSQGRVKDQSLILNYLQGASQESNLNKLANLGSGQQENRPYRPFLQPMLAFWILNHFPRVFTKSLVRALTPKKSREKVY